MFVDQAVVDRAVDWLHNYNGMSKDERRAVRSRHPRLSRGEKVTVLARVRGEVAPWTAAEALGISGRYARMYLDYAEQVAAA